MIHFLYYRKKRHSPGQQDIPELFSFILKEKFILHVNKKTWNDSVSYTS